MNFKRYFYLVRSYLGGYIKKLGQTRHGHSLFSGFLIVLLGFNSTLAISQSELLSSVQTPEPVEEYVSDLSDPETICSIRETLVGTGVAELDAKHFFDKQQCLEEEMKRNEMLSPGAMSSQDTEEQKLQVKTAQLEAMTDGYPIAHMAQYIARQDPEIAALVVGIAKKESSWGEHVPSKDGQDCYNYWGYKGQGGRGTGMGYACFESPEEAVTAVADRLATIVQKRQTSKPASLVTTWKCGSSCATHSPQSVKKWVSDVSVYYDQVLALNQ